MRTSISIALVIFAYISTTLATLVLDLEAPFQNFTCFKSPGYSFVIVKGYKSHGSVDTEGYQNLMNTKAAGLISDVYFLPCKRMSLHNIYLYLVQNMELFGLVLNTIHTHGVNRIFQITQKTAYSFKTLLIYLQPKRDQQESIPLNINGQNLWDQPQLVPNLHLILFGMLIKTIIYPSVIMPNKLSVDGLNHPSNNIIITQMYVMLEKD
ncbi:unnamed protein product [Paramecium pentaurelia]|uniref:Uncharacterized protein n=1 Tax=Paramecium pentaurelia TaxID=43138 RepID=A0A8S1SDP7_9CILI|nr:unnamed protein product [Paramecium pentaurelia]